MFVSIVNKSNKFNHMNQNEFPEKTHFEFIPLDVPETITQSTDSKDEKTSFNATYTVEEAVEAAGLGCFQLKLFMICGVLMSADAMEMLLLSVLGPALRCQWQLSSGKVALITTIVFIGYLIGAPMWGYVSDNFGRWPTFFTVLSMISAYGFLTSVSPNYIWMVILRFMVGFAIGGASSSFTLISEYLPLKSRAKVLLAFQIFWAVGCILEVALSYLVLPRFGWRWLVFASALPLSLFLFLLKFLPESARYLVTAGRLDEAEKAIKHMFTLNRVEPVAGRLVSSAYNVKKLGNLKELFNKTYLQTTLMIAPIWFGATFTYYGVVLLSSEIFRFQHYCFGDWSRPPDLYGNWSQGNVGSSMLVEPRLDTSCCQDLTRDDFIAMIVSSVGEFINVPIMVLVIDCFGRRITMGVWNGLSGLMFFLLYVCMPKVAMTGVLFLVRMFSAALLSLTYLYTTEVYPTAVRSMAVGVFSSIARFGAILTPYVAQVMLPEVSQIGALTLYAAVGVVCSILSFLLPIETAGRELPSSLE